MKKPVKLFITLAALILIAACSEKPAEPARPAQPQNASLILINGRVYTLDWDEPDQDGTVAPGAPRERFTGTVLVVDDNATNLRVLTEYLNGLGCRCDQADGAVAARQRLAAAGRRQPGRRRS